MAPLVAELERLPLGQVLLRKLDRPNRGGAATYLRTPSGHTTLWTGEAMRLSEDQRGDIDLLVGVPIESQADIRHRGGRGDSPTMNSREVRPERFDSVLHECSVHQLGCSTYE